MADPHADQPTSGQTPEQTTRSWTGWNPLFVSSLVVSGLGGLAGGEALQKLLGQYLGEGAPLPLYMALAAVPFLLVAGLLKSFFDAWWNRVRSNFERWGGMFLTGVERRYRRYMLAQSRHNITTGMDEGSGLTDFELDDVYVDVALERSSPSKISNDIFAGEEGKRQSLSRFLDGGERVILAVVGAPGSGKTTLLRHTVRRICRERGPKRRLPVLLSLNEHSEAIVKNPEVSLCDLMRKATKSIHLREPNEWFEHQLAKGRCVVMLDGLDEVGSTDRRRKVADWVQVQAKAHYRTSFIVTSRPHGYQGNRINGAEVLRTKPFSRDQVKRFVQGWFEAHERLGEKSRGKSDDLLMQIWSQGTLRELAVNPMLLTMIVSIHLYRGDLPDSRAALYREMFQVVLWKRQRNVKGIGLSMGGEEQEEILSKLAFEMMIDRVRFRSRESILSSIDRDFLAGLLDCGALVERESGEYSFAHQTFQEYLAAGYLRREGIPEGILSLIVLDPWWFETLLLFSAISDASPLVRAVLDLVRLEKRDSGLSEADLQALLFAYECAERSRIIDGQLSEKLDKFLELGTASGAPRPLAQLAAGVGISRCQSRVVPLEGGGELCARPVDVDIYKQFIYSAKREGRYPIPDFPGFVVEEASEEEGPVGGIWLSDATSFVEWANEHTPGGDRWRLPTAAELSSGEYQTFRQVPCTAWVEEDRETVFLSTVRPVKLSIEQRRKRVAEDVRKSRTFLRSLLLYGVVQDLNWLVHGSELRRIENPDNFPIDSLRRQAAGVDSIPGFEEAIRVVGEIIEWSERVIRGSGGSSELRANDSFAGGQEVSLKMGWNVVQKRLARAKLVCGEIVSEDPGGGGAQIFLPGLLNGVAAPPCNSAGFSLLELDQLVPNRVPEGWSAIRAAEEAVVSWFFRAWGPLRDDSQGVSPSVKSEVQVSKGAILLGEGECGAGEEGLVASLNNDVFRILNRSEILTPELASSIRMRALYCAMTRSMEPKVSRRSWALAETMMLIQMRQAGELPANETIILARD